MVAYRFKYYAPAVLYFLLILILSSLNQAMVTKLTWGIEDFLLHALEYHLFGITLIWAMYRDKPPHEMKPSYRLAVGIGTLLAMADEYYQSFIPSRFASVEDVVADVFGLILSIITFPLIIKIFNLEQFRRHA